MLCHQRLLLILKTPEGIIRIPTFRVSYFVLDDSIIKLVFMDGKEQILAETMKSVETTSSYFGFLRIHQNYIVNLFQELHLNTKTRELLLSTGTRVLVARDRLKQVKESLSIC
ncbi:MAG: hypothetical protein HC831_03980 [Chloroflexia bacterium]|nr:hypothetical protein [Chloroflexia bacterium]